MGSFCPRKSLHPFLSWWREISYFVPNKSEWISVLYFMPQFLLLWQRSLTKKKQRKEKWKKNGRRIRDEEEREYENKLLAVYYFSCCRDRKKTLQCSLFCGRLKIFCNRLSNFSYEIWQVDAKVIQKYISWHLLSANLGYRKPYFCNNKNKMLSTFLRHMDSSQKITNGMFHLLIQTYIKFNSNKCLKIPFQCIILDKLNKIRGTAGTNIP